MPKFMSSRTMPAGAPTAWFTRTQLSCDYVAPLELEGDRGVVYAA